jgi:hypothetical protein
MWPRDTIAHHPSQEASAVTRVIPGLVGLSLVVGLSTPGHAQQKMKLGEVLVLDVLDSAPDAAAGNALHLFKADRGTRKGQQLLASTTGARRPAGLIVAGGARRFEYHLLSPDKVGALPEVDVLGIHYTKVRPERRDAFERFVSEKIHPAVANLRPDLRVLYYKLVDGTDTSNYIALFALTRESRDKYWPGGSDSAELKAAFSPAVRGLATQLRGYLVEGSYAADEKLAAAVYESREWTDFVLVSPPR